MPAHQGVLSTVPRPFASADADGLARHGLIAAKGSEILVNERDGVITGALRYAPRPFETAELGVGVACIEHCLFLDQESDAFDELLSHCETQLRATDIGLVTCRLGEVERGAIAAFHRREFRIIECLITLGRDLPAAPAAMPPGVERATRNEADECGHVAAESFRHDRFHADPQISEEAADNLKAAWARNDCHDRADTVLVVHESGHVAGFIACRKNIDTVKIDLIGVLPEMHGRGIGRRLVDAALSHYAGGAARMIVGTQSANIASLALYQSCGFRIEASSFTLHKHLGPSAK